jgi:hypothetical protein
VVGLVLLALTAYPIWFILFERPRAGLPLRWFHLSPFPMALLGLVFIIMAALRRRAA